MVVSEIAWSPGPLDLVLSGNQLHAWCASLDLPVASVHHMSQLLAPDEQARANRFHFERDRRRFIVAHGVLRTLLGRYLSLEPSRLRFGYGLHGKPFLSQDLDGCALRFNLAHSHELAVYAFTRSHEIGIDIEFIQPLPDAEQIAARFFSERENAAFRMLPSHQRLEAFFSCWTRKEAYIKAIGDGLAHPLDQFHVSLAPGEPARLLHVESSPQEAARWSMAALAPAPGYVSALVAEASDHHLECWRFLS